MRARGWIWVACLVALAVAGGLRLGRGGAIQTDLLAMLPDTERNPVAERAFRALGHAAGDRAIFLVGGGPLESSKAAGRELAASLTGSGAFRHVLGTLPPLDPNLITGFYAPYRFRLPGPERPAQAEALADLVAQRLASPLDHGPGLDPGRDPLGEQNEFLAGLPLNSLHVQFDDGLLTVPSADGGFVLVTAELKGSAFDPLVQRDSLRAVAVAEQSLRQRWPGARLLRTGALFYAAEARTRAEWETGLISWGSLAAMVALFLLVFRSARHLLLGMVCVAAGLVAATAVTLLLFGQLYLLTLVCGASLLGVAVDYPYLYFANQLGAGPAWSARAALRRLLPALLLGVTTTLLGYATLGVAPFPGLRQMAVFSMAGLAASFLTVLLVLPDLLQRPIASRPRLLAALGRGLANWGGLRRRPWFRWGLAVVTLLLLASLARLRVGDDVKGLIQPSGRLQAEEKQIRELTGLSNSGRFFLVEGPSQGAVLAREEALRARLRPLVATGDLDGIQAVSCFVPSPAVQDQALARRRAQAPALDQALASLGFRPEARARLRAEREACPPLTVEAWLNAPFSTPLRMLWLGATEHGVGCVCLPLGELPSARLREAAAGLEGVRLVDKALSVSALLGHYRRLADAALALAVLLVWLMLLQRYGPRRSLWILAPPLLGMLAALALAGSPMTLFHSIALVLVLGFGVDYTVFLAEAPEPATLLGVLLAGSATLLSYGLLAFSHTPALRGFGLTLGIGVLVSVLLSNLALNVEEHP
jgi:predicted exporter